MRLAGVLGLLGAALANLPLLAQPESPDGPPVNLATNQPAYLTQVRHVGGPGLLPGDFAYVTFGTNRFGFVMPAGFRLVAENPQKVTLVSADLSCLLNFRVLESPPPGTIGLDPAPYRELLCSRHPGGKIVEEFSQAALGQYGPVFDLRWNAAGTVPRRERVLFIPSVAGVLEFSLVSSLENFEAGRRGFNSLLMMFRAADADGRLNMPMLSDRL